MRYGSVCSGIEAASVAWHPLGWRASFLSEIEAFPRAVLSHHYPETPLHGDFTTIKAGEYEPIDLLVGGTPCQSFSVAGLRGGLADERGNLALEYLRLAQRLRPRWLVWENVPGVLSSAGGRDFGAILGGLVELGYGFAYRVLDAQYIRVDGFGRAVPQRRRRVFVVGHLGDWRRAAAVLLERESLRGNTPPRREQGQGAAPTISARPTGGGGLGTDFDLDGGLIAADVASTLNAHFGDKQGLEDQHINGGGRCSLPRVSMCLNAGAMGRIDAESETLIPTHGAVFDVAHSLSAEGFDASEDGTGRGTPIVPVAFPWQQGGTMQMPIDDDGSIGSLIKSQSYAVAIQERAICENMDAGPGGKGWSEDGTAYTLEARNKVQAVAHFQDSEFGCQEYATAAIRAGRIPEHSMILNAGWRVRRLTPTECERLQGFPDGYTNIPYRGKNGAPDGPRYKALGNSMAVNVMRWIGRRIEMVDRLEILQARAA
jgi:DNA (cytosine-5)-methyltransferase 1